MTDEAITATLTLGALSVGAGFLVAWLGDWLSGTYWFGHEFPDVFKAMRALLVGGVALFVAPAVVMFVGAVAIVIVGALGLD